MTGLSGEFDGAGVPPVVVSFLPADGSVDNEQSANIVIRINDAGVGVDFASVVVRVQVDAGPLEVAFFGEAFQAGFDGPESEFTDLGTDCLISIDPADGLAGPSTVSVELDVSDLAGNAASFAYSFDVADTTAPYVTALVPAPEAEDVAASSSVTFTLTDAGEGVDLASVVLALALDDGTPQTVYDGGFQAGYLGASSVTPNGLGFDFVIVPDADLSGHKVTLSAEASDLAAPANAAALSFNFYLVATETRIQPVAVLATIEYHALIGAIIQLDGRRSYSPDGLGVVLTWSFVSVPIGSVIAAEVGTENSASFVQLRDDYRAVSFIPDIIGTYVVRLTATAGSLVDQMTATVRVGLSLVPTGEGTVPDLSFLWQFLSSFWSVVEDRDYFEVLWSTMTQVIGSDLTVLWGAELDRSILTAQATSARRWQRFSLRTDLSTYPQSVIVGATAAGTGGSSGPIVASADTVTNVFRVPLGTPGVAGQDDFSAIDVDYGAHGRVVVLNQTAYVIDRAYNEGATTLLTLESNDLPNGLSGVTYRIPHLLYVTDVDFEELGVRAGDVIVFEVLRRDTGLSGELQAQVVGVSGSRVGFEFDLRELTATESGPLDRSLFTSLVQELRLVQASAVEADIAAVAEAFIHHIPSGINLSRRPWTEYQFELRAKEIIHNTAIRVDDRYVSIPTLQHEIRRDPPSVFLENTNYRLLSGYLVFEDLFTTTSPSPDELWAEHSHVDNSDVIERNFGRIVGLRRGDLTAKSTRAPYLSAVKGLWYAIMRGPSVSNARLALHVLMGLPFTEARGVVVAITPNFTTDSRGHQIGRLLVEDVDARGQPTGVRHFHYYPEAVGLDLNPTTRRAYVAGDIVEPFVPLSLGVDVTDHVTDPDWWVTELVGAEVKKFHTYRAQLDMDSGVFDYNDFAFSIQFLRSIRPVYADLVAAVLQQLSDEDILGGFSDPQTAVVTLRLYDAAGHHGRSGSAPRWNHQEGQGVTLVREGSRPFRHMTPRLLRDIVTSQSGVAVRAASATGFGSGARVRVTGDATHPTVEGDILVILSGQAGAGRSVPGYYELTAGSVTTGPATLGNVPSLSDPSTWGLEAPDEDLFAYGASLLGSVIRRVANPLVRGTDLVTTAGALQLAASAGATFVRNGVGIDDHLIIESGANAGEYRIASIVAQTIPKSLVASGVPAISETTVGLVDLDGSPAVLANLSAQDFRVVRPSMVRVVVPRCKVLQSGGNMFIECLDYEAGSVVPFDVFTPGMVGEPVAVSLADNPSNDGSYVVQEYVHCGRVRVTTGSPQTSDVAASAVVRIFSKYHQGFGFAEGAAPQEVFVAELIP